METKKVVVAIIVFWLAHGGHAQDAGNRDDMFRQDVAAPVAKDDLMISERTDPEDASATRSLRGKHAIKLNMGYLSGYGVETDVSISGVAGRVGGDGFMISISYSYWWLEDFAIGVYVGIMSSEVNTSLGGSQSSLETSSVVPVLVGLKYQPLTMQLGKKVRPHLFASVGPSVRTATRSRAGYGFENKVYSETALSSHFGLGLDSEIGSVFVAGISVGYFLAADFNTPIGGRKNHSSPVLSLSVGILLGEQ